MLSVLDELENWGAILKTEPEVIHKLQAFEVAAFGSVSGDDSAQTEPASGRKPSRGPSL